MLWLPAGSAEVLNMAVPAFKATVPSTVEPSLIVTLPVGVSEEDEVGLTVAVKLSCWPNTDELAEEVRVVVVAAPVLAALSFAMNASLLPP